MEDEMKKVLVFICLFCLLWACSSDEDPGYFVSFKLNGIQYKYSEGYSYFNTQEAFGFRATDIDYSFFYGYESDNTGGYISLYILGTNTGTYSTLASEGGVSESRVYTSGTNYIRFQSKTSNSLTISVTKFGDVGDTIEGIFSGDVIDRDDDSTNTITEGVFRVKRISDGPAPD